MTILKWVNLLCSFTKKFDLKIDAKNYFLKDGRKNGKYPLMDGAPKNIANKKRVTLDS
ncbi:hypothetical protein SIN01_24110 [Sporolactobacillus inulinus]|nr:hypothetical protein SIN01_24110 [Sporolactobacillus inulinus]